MESESILTNQTVQIEQIEPINQTVEILESLNREEITISEDELIQLINELLVHEELQPNHVCGALGRVANGKSTLISKITGMVLMKYKEELEKQKTIKLGYANAKIYFCDNCPKPICYQINNTECDYCGKKLILKLHLSFVDSPGHNDYQTTALSGAASMDSCLLVMSADCTQDPETNEHFKTVKILELTNTIGIHNKIDTVTIGKAFDHFEIIKSKYDLRYVVPISAQHGFGLNYLYQIMIETIPRPINTEFIKRILKPLKVSVIRSFDINKQGTNVKDLKGGVVGGTISRGVLKIGDIVKIIPGLFSDDGRNLPLQARITNLRTGETNLEKAYPGGLIGIGLSLDPILAKEDKLVGNFIVGPDDETNKFFKICTINYSEYDPEDPEKIQPNIIYNCMIGSTKRLIKILKLNKNSHELKFMANLIMVGEIGDRVIITTRENKIKLCGTIKSFEE